jgi:hypothetical protein
MNMRNYLIDAIDVVLAWDLPDDALANAAIAQAGLMARISPDALHEFFSD